PSIDCIIISRPTKSRPLYIQMVGRGTRKFPGKDDCLILDLVGVTARHDLITVAELSELGPQDLGDETVAEAVASKRRRAVVYTADGELVAVDVNLFGHRPLHWVQAREGSFTLSLGGEEGWVVLRARPGDRWDVVRMTPKGTLTTLASGQSLAYAQGRAEDYV